MIKIITAKNVDNHLGVSCCSGTEVVIPKSFCTCYRTEQKNACADTAGTPVLSVKKGAYKYRTGREEPCGVGLE